MPVQIYTDDASHRELAEYFHFGSVHDLRITGPDLLVKKIIKMPQQKPSNDGSVAAKISYKIVDGKVMIAYGTSLFRQSLLVRLDSFHSQSS